MFTVSPDIIKYADNLAVEKYGIAEITLMKNAASMCYSEICARISKHEKIVILCGKGNNGGDGYELASLLHKALYDVTLINVFDCEPVTKTARTVYQNAIDNSVKIKGFSDWKEVLAFADVIIDALFGVGFYGKIDKDSEIGQMLCFCNSQNAKRIATKIQSR